LRCLFGLNQEGGTLSLETKAKTTKQIIQLVDKWYDNGAIYSNFMGEKWVLLDYAQKLENEVIILNTAHDLRVARINQLEKQIAEANKILDEIEPDHVLYQYWTVMFKELREALR
jgi:hypothetical protein